MGGPGGLDVHRTWGMVTNREKPRARKAATR